MRYHYTFLISVYPKDKNDQRSFWFQGGKLTCDPDFSKNASSNKGFRTSSKLESFLRWLDTVHPDTVVKVLEIRPNGKRWIFEIPMGDNWKEYISQDQ